MGMPIRMMFKCRIAVYGTIYRIFLLWFKEGLLSEEKEFYAPVRLRGGHHVSDLEDHGVQYIELRNIDLNPFETIWN